MHPPFSFRSCRKENGPHPHGVRRIRKRQSRQRLRSARSKRKERLAQNLRMRAGLLTYGSCSEYVLTKFSSLLPARAGPLPCAGLAPRLPVWWKFRGGCRKVCSSKFACALLGGGWRAGDGRMWASAPTGVMGTWRPCKHTGPPLIPSCRGRRPRRPASSADNRQDSASGKRSRGYPGPPRA